MRQETRHCLLKFRWGLNNATWAIDVVPRNGADMPFLKVLIELLVTVNLFNESPRPGKLR